MSRFSERHGYRAVRAAIQVDGIDDELWTAIWNVLSMKLWARLESHGELLEINHRMKAFAQATYADFLNLPIERMPTWVPDIKTDVCGILRDREWYWLYDFTEFCIDVYSAVLPNESSDLVQHMNRVLERQGSGYRIVDGELAPITTDYEIAAIEEATSGSAAAGLHAVRDHLQAGLRLLADKTDADYRNSVKESISAVEALVNLLVGGKRATLGEALKKVDPAGGVHPALLKAFSAIYGYTSDAEGIRHAMLDEDTVDQEDALYMLVSCSAFVNYVVAKAAKSGVEFGSEA
jgi:hypothetical protein